MTECQICHQNQPREGRSICGVCMGLEENPMDSSIATSMDQTPHPPIEPEQPVKPIGSCSTCGQFFEPYKLGANLVRSGICYSCVMRKKYGPDWVPGGNRQAVNARAKAKRDAKKAAGNGGPKQVFPVETPKQAEQWKFEGCPTIPLKFFGTDRKMYEQLMSLSLKERRTLEQQVLYLLDGAMEQP